MTHRSQSRRAPAGPLGGLLAALLLCGLLGAFGCAPAHIPVETAPAASQPSAGRGSVVAAARSLTGLRYKWGGDSPQEGFDCAGLTWWSFRQVGVALPRVSTEQYEVGTPVNRRDIRPGDLVFYRLPGAPKSLHVGIATERGTFIHSPREGGHVREDFLDSPYWRQRFVGARRIAGSNG